MKCCIKLKWWEFYLITSYFVDKVSLKSKNVVKVFVHMSHIFLLGRSRMCVATHA